MQEWEGYQRRQLKPIQRISDLKVPVYTAMTRLSSITIGLIGLILQNCSNWYGMLLEL